MLRRVRLGFNFGIGSGSGIGIRVDNFVLKQIRIGIEIDLKWMGIRIGFKKYTYKTIIGGYDLHFSG